VPFTSPRQWAQRLDSRGDGLDVRDELRVQSDVEAIRASHGVGMVEGFDVRAKDRESHALDVGQPGGLNGKHGLSRAAEAPSSPFGSAASVARGSVLRINNWKLVSEPPLATHTLDAVHVI